MRLVFLFVFLGVFALVSGQQRLEMTPKGFAPVNLVKPKVPNDKIIEHIRSWVSDFNKSGKYPYEVYSVTPNSLKIDAFRQNAFFYQNKAETFQHRIKYTIAIDLLDDGMRYDFKVIEIWGDDQKLETTLASFYNSSGKIKSDFPDVKPSLEKTVNYILLSFEDYMRRL